MKLLTDQNLPRSLSLLLTQEGYDAIHTEDVALARASDPTILAWCCKQNRVLITADKKLTKYLATTYADCPSVVITRDMRALPLKAMSATLTANLPSIGKVIDTRGNAVFSLAPDKPIRASFLPLQAPARR